MTDLISFVIGWIMLALLIVVIGWTVAVRTALLTAEQLFGTRALPSPPPVPPGVRALHDRLTVVDVHADTLIWRRNLLRRARWGHFDFPRMADGGVALQGFLVVTEAPRLVIGGGLTDKSDRLTALGMVDQWPIRAIAHQVERALYLGSKLQHFCDRSGGSIMFIQTATDLRGLLARRAAGQDVRGAYLGLEGADGTGYVTANLQRLFDAGFRMAELCHYTDTAFAASSSGLSLGGLTPLGVEAVQVMDRLGMVVDLAHASPRTVEQVLRLSALPPLITHTGSASCHHDPKCLPDTLLRDVVARGGVVGLGFVPDYVGGSAVEDVVRALDHLVQLLGADGVVLGSGFCALPLPIAVDHFPHITAALMARGYPEPAIAKIMGGNAVRYLLSVLPGHGDAVARQPTI